MTMTDHYRGGGGNQDRGERFDRDRGSGGGGFSSLSSLGGISSGMQSSMLGFMAKPEMPLHLSILFRAR